jgi:hypothetical protein
MCSKPACSSTLAAAGQTFGPLGGGLGGNFNAFGALSAITPTGAQSGRSGGFGLDIGRF